MRAVGDALKGNFWIDDAQIVRQAVGNEYAGGSYDVVGGSPRAEILIEAL